MARRRIRLLLAGALLVALVGAPPASGASRLRVPAGCAAYAGPREVPPVVSLDPRPHAPRVFAIQYRQDPRWVETYGSFRAKIDCLLREYVLPWRARGRPNLVAFDEDTGLATVATGSRGATARDYFTQRGGTSCEGQGFPCATLGALGALSAAYAAPLSVYQSRFPSMSGLDDVFVAATDTIVRSFLGTFSTLARRYGLYLLASGDVAPFRQSSDPADLAAFSDPDLSPRPGSVYVATAPPVYNEAFVWGPREVRRTGPDVLRNVVQTNLKVPLTSLEQEIGFAAGPANGPAAVANLRPYTLPGTPARIGIATSLPAFTYGAPGPAPCADVSLTYMRCLNALGANLVVQDEANPGRWTGPDGDGIEQWQPMSWNGSTLRTVLDPSVRFAYNVTPMMTGNLADLAFDGQTAIVQRGGTRGRGCHYIGNAAFVPGEDESPFRAYAGRQRDYVALAPWVTADGPRAALRAVGAQLAPGSGSAIEDGYLETALVTDLPFPPDRRRAGCAG